MDGEVEGAGKGEEFLSCEDAVFRGRLALVFVSLFFFVFPYIVFLLARILYKVDWS